MVLSFSPPPLWPSGKASSPRVEDSGVEPCFLWLSCISDLQIASLVVALSDTWHYNFGSRTDCPGVSIFDLQLVSVWQHIILSKQNLA